MTQNDFAIDLATTRSCDAMHLVVTLMVSLIGTRKETRESDPHS